MDKQSLTKIILLTKTSSLKKFSLKKILAEKILAKDWVFNEISFLFMRIKNYKTERYSLQKSFASLS